MKTFLSVSKDLLLFFMTLALIGTMFASAYSRYPITDESLLETVAIVTIMLIVYILIKIALYCIDNFNVSITKTI